VAARRPGRPSGRQLAPVLKDPEPPPLPEFIEQLLRTIADFGQDKRDGIDRLLAALHAWSHSQSDPGLKAAGKLPEPMMTVCRCMNT
jgi:hypothetical protein